MFDAHFDLLTFLYYLHKKNNLNHERLIFYLKNISGGIFNLYFTNNEEMLSELNIDLNKESMKYIFDKSLEIFNKLKIDTNKYIFSIEGLTYLDNVDDLDYYYNLGVRSILPVWNYDNKYGGGVSGTNNLTIDGVKLIDKATELGITIDLSHANEGTFKDIIDYIRTLEIRPNVITSHSNVYNFCDHARNLKDYQIQMLKEINATLGLVLYKPFISRNYKDKNSDMNKEFLKHLDYLLNKMNISEDNIMLSIDDMQIVDDPFYLDTPLFDLENISINVRNLLETHYSKEVIDKIMYKNAERIIQKRHK